MTRSSLFTARNTLRRYQTFDERGTTSQDETSIVVSSPVESFLEKTDSTRRRKPVGWLYPTDYDLNKTIYRWNYGTWRREAYYRYRPFYGRLRIIDTLSGYQGDGALSMTNECPLPSIDFGALRAKAETNALLRLKDQKINLGVALAETRQLGNMVASTAIRLANSYRSLKRGQWKKAGRYLGLRLRDQPGNWLELQYGWKPLLSDVHGAADALSQRESVSDWVVTVKALAKAELEKVAFYDRNVSGDFRYSVARKWGGGVFVRLDYHPSNLNMLTHPAAALGLTNPLQVGWEVVPFSFVVDWFVPVGNFLSTLDATLGFEFLSGSFTEKSEASYEFEGRPTSWSSSSYDYRITNSCRGSGMRKYLKRRTYAGSPIPALRVKNPLSYDHVANGLSLLAQAFGRR